MHVSLFSLIFSPARITRLTTVLRYATLLSFPHKNLSQTNLTVKQTSQLNLHIHMHSGEKPKEVFQLKPTHQKSCFTKIAPNLR